MRVTDTSGMQGISCVSDTTVAELYGVLGVVNRADEQSICNSVHQSSVSS